MTLFEKGSAPGGNYSRLIDRDYVPVPRPTRSPS